jgi:hypothetical protein
MHIKIDAWLKYFIYLPVCLTGGSSPPYIKSIDYVYNQMVEFFWIGDLFNMDTQPKQNKKRKKYTG